MKSRHSLLPLFAVLIIALASPAFASHGWSTYHWSRSCGTCPKNLTIYSATAATSKANWPDHVQKSVFGDPANPNTANRLGWNDSIVFELSVVGSSSNRRQCSAVAGAVKVCNATYGLNGWLGLAQIWLSSGHISQGTTKLNDSYFNAYNYPITEQRHVTCQEIGHDFGLGHTSENGTSQNTCMDYYQNTSNSDWTSTGPNTHDFAQLETQHHWGTSNITSFMDAMTQAARIPAHLVGIELNEQWQWGTPIEWNAEGKAVTYFLQVGPEHDEGILTHVYPVRENVARDPNHDRRDGRDDIGQ